MIHTITRILIVTIDMVQRLLVRPRVRFLTVKDRVLILERKNCNYALTTGQRIRTGSKVQKRHSDR